MVIRLAHTRLARADASPEGPQGARCLPRRSPPSLRPLQLPESVEHITLCTCNHHTRLFHFAGIISHPKSMRTAILTQMDHMMLEDFLPRFLGETSHPVSLYLHAGYDTHRGMDKNL